MCNAFVRDISERRAHELALREAEAMFRGAFTVCVGRHVPGDSRWLSLVAGESCAVRTAGLQR